jgi:hypothetical protein
VRTVHVETDLPAPATRVWEAMQQPATFLYVVRGTLGVPALAGRTAPLRAGEVVTGWIFLFHVLPVHRHRIEVAAVDPAVGVVRTEERGGVLRRWDHVLQVAPVDAGSSRYSDTVDIDAGPLTGVVAAWAELFYRYRQARWRRLARRHLARPAPPSTRG